MALAEIKPCAAAVSGGEALSPEDKKELDRQYNLFGLTAFDFLKDEPDKGKRAERLAVVSELKQLACDVRKGVKTMDDFLARQDKLMAIPANEFLELPYPGLNFAGWRVMMALADPLKYGREIMLSSGSWHN